MDGTHIRLSWDLPTEGRPQKYEIRWAPVGYGDQPFQQGTDVGGGHTETYYYSDTLGHPEAVYHSGLPDRNGRPFSLRIRPGHRYAFQMRSRSGDDVSEWMELQVLYPSQSDAIPASPNNLQASRSGRDITLTWEKTADTSVTRYTLRRTGPRSGDEVLTDINNRRSNQGRYVDRDLAEGVWYGYSIFAHNNRGSSAESLGVTVYVPEANDRRSGANDLGDITGAYEAQFPTEDLDRDDSRDYFRFELTEARTVGIGLRQLDQQAHLYLENHEGSILESSENDFTNDEWIKRELAPGVYYIRVQARSSGDNNYVLRYGVNRP